MESETKLLERIEAIATQLAASNATDKLNQLESELNSLRSSVEQRHREFAWKVKFLAAVASVLERVS